MLFDRDFGDFVVVVAAVATFVQLALLILVRCLLGCVIVILRQLVTS